MILWAPRGYHQSLGAHRYGSFCGGDGAVKVLKRDVSGSKQSLIDRAEISHHAIVCGCCAVTQVWVTGLVEAKITQTKGGKNQLARSTDVINGRGAVFLQECTLSIIVLTQHNVFASICTESLIRLALLRIFDSQSIPYSYAQIWMIEKSPE